MSVRWLVWVGMGVLVACGETRRHEPNSLHGAGAPQQGGASGSASAERGAAADSSGTGGVVAGGGQGASAGSLVGEAGAGGDGIEDEPPERDPMAARFPMPNPVGSGLPRPASYDTSADGVVVDNVTGLIWQREVAPDQYDWSSANQYCEELDLAGHTDWRLPRRIELVSLVDYTRAAPAIDRVAFPDVPSEFFWTAGIESRHAGIDFRIGFTQWLPPEWEARVRCVKGSTRDEAPPRAFMTTELTVLDRDTGLQWERDFTFETPVSHEEARAKCEALTLEGHSDWRVPSMKELQTLVDERYQAPALDPVIFPTASADISWYETSTPVVLPSSIGDEVWELRFNDGVTQAAPAFVDGGVQCVR